MSGKPEVWLLGPLNDVTALLQPVAHALLQAREEVDKLAKDLNGEILWESPAGLASPGFHLQHLRGVLDRLFTYARGEQLTAAQLAALGDEGKTKQNIGELLEAFNKQVDAAISQLKQTDPAILTDRRDVGRAKLPSTVIGLYVHAAEHTMRHVGQLLVTVKVVSSS